MPPNRRSLQLGEPLTWGLSCLVSPFILLWVLLFRREWRLISALLAYIASPLLATWFLVTRRELDIVVGAWMWEIRPRASGFNRLIHLTAFARSKPRQRHVGPFEVVVGNQTTYVDGRLQSRGRVTLRLFARCPDRQELRRRRTQLRTTGNHTAGDLGPIRIDLWRCR